MAERRSTFEDLNCWKAGRELYLFVRREVVSIFPANEKYDLTSQIVRSARSVKANIAEGYGRFHYKDDAKFLSYARGSAHETLDHMLTAVDDGYIYEDILKRGRGLIDESIRLINGYRAYVLKRKRGD
ncbi:four helix bundle protein [Coraliomargarita sinensis]|uniref:Four helix bundle protein n=1 Tax=Coraliomargarita sinensis TaxID=2174842 RepID=A0A317ZII0_9BACT|nr:four helix bundle protein [Coraliomargarita sinensis]PXA03708.1 four helix bundle protein [Coraliomargarita sinensis]